MSLNTPHDDGAGGHGPDEPGKDPRTSRRAVFLDRDGVINEETGRHIVRAEELRFIPGSLEAIGSLCRAGWKVVVYTNQSGVGRGLMTTDDLESIHSVIRCEVASHGGELMAIYSCIHHPDEGCACRKPLPGMILQAAADHDLDLSASYAVGDSPRDIAAAQAAGCIPVLVLSGSTSDYAPDLFPAAQPRHIFPDLAAFADWLLNNR
jgi:histidinol-phosphate phosphatase family protein